MKKKIAVMLICVLLVSLVSVLGGIFNVRSIQVLFLYKQKQASAADIIADSGLQLRASILNINETSVKAKVSRINNDRSVEVYDIERVFPNKVILKVKAHNPMFYLESENGKTYLADVDFQLNKEIESNVSSLIPIIGYKLQNDVSFDSKELKTVKYVISIMLEKWNADAIRAVIKEIEIKDQEINFLTMSNDSFKVKIFSSKELIDKETKNINDEVESFYNMYMEKYYS